MKDLEDFGIPVWMPFHTFLIFISQCHNIWMCVYIDQVLCLTQIIGGVVDSKDAMLIYMVADK
jgi:hypothetical protein